ncbi:MAG: trascription regulator domain protein [Thermoleophilia bacterium]|nr:trascription regulator domain protein [Thermoleophilia bacterium]
MPTTEKPYRVYRQPRRVRGDGTIAWDGADASGPGGPKGAGAPRRVLRFVRRAVFLVIAVGIVWSAIAFLSFRSAVNERNDQLPEDVRAALAPTDGPAISSSQVTLLVGADTSAHRVKTGENGKRGRADTLMLMRTDVPSRTVSFLSIPRDLYVEIPGMSGQHKINEAYGNGGLPLAIRTARRVTGIDINHVVQVDFDGFKDVVDELGGIEIDNPTQIRGPRNTQYWFDGGRWFFPKGKQTLDGKHALAYARIRHVDDATIARDPSESTDLGRARRQQRVIDAIISEVASPSSLRHPRGVPRAVVGPLTTDISASEMLSFGFGKVWSKGDNNLRCRLGGDPEDNGDGSVIVPDERNRAAVRMFLGKQAAAPPEDQYAAGCTKGG